MIIKVIYLKCFSAKVGKVLERILAEGNCVGGGIVSGHLFILFIYLSQLKSC